MLIDYKGDWYLSDFGSSTPPGDKLWSFTPVSTEVLRAKALMSSAYSALLFVLQ